MNTAPYYAKALFELAQSHPEKTKQYFKNLRQSLALRGHEKLLPRILSEYQKLDLQKKRTQHYNEVTPETERTDALLQLYRRLVATP